MLRKLLIIALPCLLIACASSSDVTSAGAVSENLTVATLADANDPIQMAAAPVVTRASFARMSAAKLLKQRAITQAAAEKILACTDATINILNAGVGAKSIETINSANVAAGLCLANIESAKLGAL